MRLTFADLGTKRDVLGSSTLYLLFGAHVVSVLMIVYGMIKADAEEK